MPDPNLRPQERQSWKTDGLTEKKEKKMTVTTGGNVTTGTGTEGDGNKPNDDNKSAGDGFKPVTYKTQAELDAAFSERANRAAATARAEALKGLPDGVDLATALQGYTEWKKAEDAKKDPAVLANEKAQEIQRELDAYKAKEQVAKLRTEVSKDDSLKIADGIQLPPELLAGSTKEEMLAHGKAILDFFSALAGSAPRAPGYNPFQGHTEQQQQRSADPIRSYFETGSFQ